MINGLLGDPVPATVEGFADIWKGSGEVLEDSFQSIPSKSKMVRGERREDLPQYPFSVLTQLVYCG